MRIRLIITLLTAVLLAACGTNETSRLLDDVESYIRQHPDSALNALRRIDASHLGSKANRGHYSLLYAMALDKNYIDITDMSVIQPALDYYDADSDPDHCMQAYYYLGRIQQNAGNSADAMQSFTTALDISKRSEDNTYKGMLHSIIAVLYSSGYNSKQALYHGQQAYLCFQKTGNARNQWLQQGALIVYYGNNREKEKADSVFQLYEKSPVLDSAIFAKNLFAYAKTLSSRRPYEPEKGIAMFNMARLEYKGRPSVEDYFVYANALDQVGKTKESDFILNKLSSVNTVSANYWRYHVYRRRGLLAEALPYLEDGVRKQDSLIISSLNQSLEDVQKAFFEEKAQVEESKKDVATARFWLLIIVVGIAISLIVCIWIRARQRLLEKLEKISMLKEEVDMQLALLKESEVKETDYRKKYLSVYKNQYQLLNNLCASYLSPSRSDPKEKVFKEVESVLKEISNDKENPSHAEIIVNNAWDNIMNRIRKDYPSFSENDYKLIALSVMGFEAKTISLLMNYTPKTVYGKKARIKQRIADSSVAAKQEYLAFLSEK